MMSTKVSPPESFVQFFSQIYGERWPALFAALQDEELQVARNNAFTNQVSWNGQGEIPRGENALLTHYVMDPASIFAAQVLGVQAGEKILDMCAAPGGKTLLLAEALGKSGELIANELSEARRERLKKVIQQYVPRDVREHVFVTGKDGGKFALSHPRHFDRVLVDAPCSGERHLLKNPKELSQWSESRSKKLAQRQYALLTAALLAVKQGGFIVYSTCSISPIENDAVIEQLVQRKGASFQLQSIENHGGAEATQYGYQFLPDRKIGGPIYFALLRAK